MNSAKLPLFLGAFLLTSLGAQASPFDPAEVSARFLLHPGVFALFLPGEAHMTQVATGAPGDGVVKLVVKVDAKLL